MKELNNQTIYQCSYCGKKNFTKRGSKLHEDEYCKHSDSPHMIAIKKRQYDCKHLNTETVYRYIPGECVQEPDYDQCIDCGAVVYPIITGVISNE